MIHYAFVSSDGTLSGVGAMQDGMESYIAAPGGTTISMISEATYNSIGLTGMGSWRKVGSSIVQRSAMALTINKASITANGIDEMVIGNIPNPSQVSVSGSGSDGAFVEVTTGTINITSEDPGPFTVVVRSPIHVEWRNTYAAV